MFIEGQLSMKTKMAVIKDLCYSQHWNKASIFNVTHLFDKNNEDKLNNNMFYASRSSTVYQMDVVKHKETNPHDHKKWDFCFMTSPVHLSSLKKIDLDDRTKFHAA